MSANHPADKPPSLLQSLTPVIALVVMLASSVYLYGADSSYGANQIALLLAAGLTCLIGIRNGLSWAALEKAIVDGIGISLGAVLILLAVGSLIGTWILSGTVQTLIYYGLQIMHPAVFYPATAIICALVGLAIGSSWTVAGTLGIALIGVASGLGLSPAITAGAIISGAYFGDKMSPLSDTTNLAPAVAGSELFSHIRHMMWSTVPSILIAVILFSIIGFTAHAEGGSTERLDAILATLEGNYSLGAHLLLPLLLVLYMAIRKYPAFPTIFTGALVGGIFAALFQSEAVIRLAGVGELSTPMALLSGVWTALFNGYQASTGNAAVDDLLTRGGMSSMLNTVWLIMSAMTFGAAMERTGMLARLVEAVLGLVRGTGSLIIVTLATAIGCNIITADQYISIVLPGRLYRLEFDKRGLAPVNLSRALEDAATITSPLVPWNTCGAYMAATLGVPTLVYLPYAFFNYINPFVAAGYAFLGWTLKPMEDATGERPRPEARPD